MIIMLDNKPDMLPSAAAATTAAAATAAANATAATDTNEVSLSSAWG